MERTWHRRDRRDPAPQRGASVARRLALWLPLLLLLSLPLHAHAQFTPRDAQIIARTLSFVEPRQQQGTLSIGIAYDPARPDSAREAASLQAAIGRGLRAGAVMLTARLLPIDQLRTVDGIAGIFVTAGLGIGGLDAVDIAARRLRIPSISTEMSCVRTARCILGFSSAPTVEIILNHAAASSAGVHFTPAFRMLVREL